MIEVLSKFYEEGPQGESASIQMGAGEAAKYLKLSMSNISIDQDEYRVATFTDETESKTLARVEQQNNLLSMLQ